MPKWLIIVRYILMPLDTFYYSKSGEFISLYDRTIIWKGHKISYQFLDHLVLPEPEEDGMKLIKRVKNGIVTFERL